MLVAVIANGVANGGSDNESDGLIILVGLCRQRQAQAQAYNAHSNPMHSVC
jgi:hypothetical protein